MTRSLPKRPLWPRSGRSGRRVAAASSSSTCPAGADGTAPAIDAAPAASPPADTTSRPKPTGRSAMVALLGERPQAFHPREEPALPVFEPGFDVGREQEPSPGGPHTEGDRNGELGLVADGDRHPAHAQLSGPGGGPAVEADGGLAGWQPLDLDVAPADPPNPKAQDLAHGLLGRPAAGHRLRAAADVPLLRGGQDPPDEAIAESLQRGPDPLDPDDVDTELGRPGRHQPRRDR